MPRPENPSLPLRVAPASFPHLVRFAMATTLTGLVFIIPLWDLVRFAWPSDLFSYTLLIAPTTAWLIWLRRHQIPGHEPASWWPALICAAIALGLLGLRYFSPWAQSESPIQDRLFLSTLAFVFSVVCCAWMTLGKAGVMRSLFPLLFLVFMAPFPSAVENALETALQYGSAEAAYLYFLLSPTPLLRDGLIFHLPGISIQVAPECSGIHSSVVLFITSLVAGTLLLRSPRRRIILALAVIPLALARNGLRVFVIGELCVRISPDMIHSVLHRRGGPLFFALSLIPLIALLILLARGERRRAAKTDPMGNAVNLGPAAATES